MWCGRAGYAGNDRVALLRPIVPVAHLLWARPAALEATWIGILSVWARNPGGPAPLVPWTQSGHLPSQFGRQSHLAIACLTVLLIFVLRFMLGLALGWHLLQNGWSIVQELQQHFSLVLDTRAGLAAEESNRVRVPVTAGLIRMQISLQSSHL
jgi:hypothetical protein